MERQEMTENAALVLTEWVHTLARELRRLPEPPSPQQVAGAAARRCPGAADGVAEAVSAAGAAERLLPELPMRSGEEAVLRLERTLPEALSETQRRGYFSLLLTGLGADIQGLDQAGGGELRRRLGELLEERADRLLACMTELACSGAAGLEPAKPEPLEGVLAGRQLSVLAAAVFCTAADGLLDGTWQWPAAVGVSLAAGGRLTLQLTSDGTGFSGFCGVQESLRGAALLALTTLCLQVFATSGGELEKMEELLRSPEECPDVLARQIYGLLGHVGAYYTEHAETALGHLSGALHAYGAYRGREDEPQARQAAAIPAKRFAEEWEQEQARNR